MKRNLIVVLVALMAVGSSVFLAQAEEHAQRELKMSQIPPAVQKVVKQEAAKHPLVSIATGEDESTKTFEMKFRDGAQILELKVAASGRVVSRELERSHLEDREERND